MADAEFTEFHQRLGKIVPPGSFHFHYARLIEALYGLEVMEALLNDPAVLGQQIRAHAGVNCLEGVGMIEAPPQSRLRRLRASYPKKLMKSSFIMSSLLVTVESCGQGTGRP